MTGSLVVAIDVGIKNLSLCVFDFATNRVEQWETVSLVKQGRYIPSLNVEYVRDFVEEKRSIFDNAFVVVIERQMRANMRVIEALLQYIFVTRCVVVSPRSVKVHYDIGCRNYRANKQKAVRWAKAFCLRNPTAFASGLDALISKAKKADDLADSLLLLMYYLDTYSNQMTTGTTTEWEQPVLD